MAKVTGFSIWSMELYVVPILRAAAPFVVIESKLMGKMEKMLAESVVTALLAAVVSLLSRFMMGKAINNIPCKKMWIVAHNSVAVAAAAAVKQ